MLSPPPFERGDEKKVFEEYFLFLRETRHPSSLPLSPEEHVGPSFGVHEQILSPRPLPKELVGIAASGLERIRFRSRHSSGSRLSFPQQHRSVGGAHQVDLCCSRIDARPWGMRRVEDQRNLALGH